MAHDVKQRLIAELGNRFANVTKLPDSQSLYEIDHGARIYIRYSRVHPDNRTFYGLRQADLRQLEGHQSLICFLWDSQAEPLLIPFRDFEEVFAALTPASDGQYKAQVYSSETGTELYIAKAGRFNVESYFGWNETNSIQSTDAERWNRELSHSQVQTLLGTIGTVKGLGVWLPRGDRSRIDAEVARSLEFANQSFASQEIARAASEIDVIWFRRGSNELTALFEIEHSTPIYSGLLRFNDVRLLMPALQPRFTIVANDSRRSRFTTQIGRPTFRTSGLNDVCTFLDYANVLEWHKRLTEKQPSV